MYSPLIAGISMRCGDRKVNAFGFSQLRDRVPDETNAVFADASASGILNWSPP